MALLSYSDLLSLGITFSRHQCNRWARQGQFPAAVQLSPRKIAWREADVLAWLTSRPQTQSSQAAPVRAPRPPRRKLVPIAVPRRKRIGDVS